MTMLLLYIRFDLSVSLLDSFIGLSVSLLVCVSLYWFKCMFIGLCVSLLV